MKLLPIVLKAREELATTARADKQPLPSAMFASLIWQMTEAAQELQLLTGVSRTALIGNEPEKTQ